MGSAHTEIAQEGVSFVAYYAKNNKLENIKYLNHNLIHIVIGFNDFLTEFCNINITKKKHSLLVETKNITI